MVTIRRFENTIELLDGTLFMQQDYKYWPATFHNPEEWEDYDAVFKFNEQLISRSEVLAKLSSEEFAAFVDDATEVSVPYSGPDH